MADTTSSEKVQAKTEHAAMVASSETSTPSARRPTRKTVKLTAEEAVQILQQAIINCQLAGIDAAVTQFYWHGTQTSAIILPGVIMDDKHNLVLNASTGTSIADTGNQ